MTCCSTMIEESVVLGTLLCHYVTCNSCYSSERGEKNHSYLHEEREIYSMDIKGMYVCLPLKNSCVPQDMLVLSVMTLGADPLRQIATDPHGFSRAHSIGNGLFNFPQGALPFPRSASLKRVWSVG